jgi:hypothetical protein
VAFFTDAGNQFAEDLTDWLQDTRLMSEAIRRLYHQYQETGKVECSAESWPKPPKDDLPIQEFEIKPVELAQRMDVLLRSLWRGQFVFLESLWEEYLQNLVLELRLRDASVFEPFCEKDYMAGVVRDILSGRLSSIDEIKDEAAARFAAGITRQPWRDQWTQLARLEIGLSSEDSEEQWYPRLDEYFEMRNCIVHRQGQVSDLLHQKTDYYKAKSQDVIEIWPTHLDFYRRRFIECVAFIESKIQAKYGT